MADKAIVKPDGEPNVYYLFHNDKWVCRVLFNGELMPVKQEQLMQAIANVLDKGE